mgnify:CR=1 FL=1
MLGVRWVMQKTTVVGVLNEGPLKTKDANGCGDVYGERNSVDFLDRWKCMSKDSNMKKHIILFSEYD